MSEKWKFYSETGEEFEVDTEPGRNDPCPCRSGRKFKRCCGAEDAYNWPMLTLISAEAGSIVVHAHCLRNRATGARVLMAVVPQSSPSERMRRREMVQMVRRIAAGVGDDVVPITEADIDESTCRLIAGKLLENPETKVVLVPWPELAIR